MNLDELLKAAINDPTKRSVFLQTLIRSDIYVICKNPVKHGENNEGVQMELITIQNPEGDLFIPFFTSYRALQKFAKRYVECYKLNCLRFFDLIQNVSAVLNPNSYGKEFSSPEIKSILMIARNLHIKAISYNEAEIISYRQPQHSVSHLTRAATKFFAKQPNVDRAFIMEMTRGSERPQILIIVDMLGNTRKLFVPLARHLSAFVKSGEHLCFLSYEQENAQKAVEGVVPFYVRKKRFFEK